MQLQSDKVVLIAIELFSIFQVSKYSLILQVFNLMVNRKIDKFKSK